MNIENINNKKFLLGLFLSFLLSAFLTYSLIEPHFLKVNPIEFRDNDIPAPFNNKKIIFVADIHHGPFFSRKRVSGLVEKINNLNPDLECQNNFNFFRSTFSIKPLSLPISQNPQLFYPLS